NEVSGILPIPPDVRSSSGMSEYMPSLELEGCKRQHVFLARKQGTRKPALPIHTPAERDMFRKLMRENEAFSPKNGSPNWKEAVKVWNYLADGQKELTYKLIEQLTAYYNTWKINLNVKETLSRTLNTRKPVLEAIRNPARSAHAPPVPKRPAKPNSVNHGFNVPINTSPTPRNSDNVQQAAAVSTQAAGTSSTSSIQGYISRKRVGDHLVRTEPAKRARKPRRCQKCFKDGCKGKKEVRFCGAVCLDCKKSSCRGRNSKKPDVPCWEAWL
ncbi:hypothetical protein BDZ97DRAFT_1650717, partial [Flammula alnicola]